MQVAQPHVFGMSRPQTSPPSAQPWQVPQSMVLPQPSLTGPQPAPSSAQVFGVQASTPPSGIPQTFGIPPPPQVSGTVHVPQSSVPPQQSEAMPQSKPRSAQGVGPGQSKPHWCPSQPNPHIRPTGQVPQSRTCPQPSSAVPQLKPCSAQVIDTQASPSSPASPPAFVDVLLLVIVVVVEPPEGVCVVEEPPDPELDETLAMTVLPQAAATTITAAT